MQFALISDIHGNLPALEAVLDDIAQRNNIDATYHLGDLVGYGPWPNEVIARLREERIFGIAGNYDSTTATDYKHCGCKYENAHQELLSHSSYEWTIAHLTLEAKSFLACLPFRIDLRPLGGHVTGPTITLLHGNQILNTVYVTEDRSDAFLQKIAQSVGAKTGDVICFGHTHHPWHRVLDGMHFINVGSVGRPKDGDWRAGYVLLDISSNAITSTVVRVSYNIETAVKGVYDSELPNEFATFLQHGGESRI